MVMEKSEKQLPILPNDVILEILSYLPSQTLKRFSRVLDELNLTASKTPLLQTPSFVKKHAFNMAHHTSKQRQVSNQLVLTCDRTLGAPVFSTISLDNNNRSAENTTPLFSNGVCRVSEILPTEKECLIRLEPTHTRVIGSCYGVVFMSVGFGHCHSRIKFHHIIKREAVMNPEALIFWNPFTGEHYRGPIPIKLGPYGPAVYGFGYDFKNKTFKALIAQLSMTHIYDLSSDSWELVESINWSTFFYYCHPLDKFGEFAKGSLHWLVSRDKVLAFDLATKACTYIALPSSMSIANRGRGWVYNEKQSLKLGVLRLESDDYLAISINELDSLEVGIWVMKEYGRPEQSWVKQYSIKKDPSLIDMKLEPPLWVSQDGELVFNVVDGIGIWHPKSKDFTFTEDNRKTECKTYPHLYNMMMLHVTTFMSPKPN